MDRYSDSHPPKSSLLDPTNDVVWKLLLTAPHRKHLLLSFVNAVLQLKKPIRDLKVLNPEITRESLPVSGRRPSMTGPLGWRQRGKQA